ncbi:MAG: 50S ribosomal protein L6 [Methanocellales archaeon]
MIVEKVKIPQNVNVYIEGKFIRVTGPRGELKRELWSPVVSIRKQDSNIIIESSDKRRKARAIIGTLASHISNMMKGVVEGFECRLKIVYAHFPIQVKIEGDKVLIINFLGEKRPRMAQIVGKETKVKITSDEVIVTGIDKEAVGQTAANIEQTTRIKGYDPRVFQDGIYITVKA